MSSRRTTVHAFGLISGLLVLGSLGVPGAVAQGRVHLGPDRSTRIAALSTTQFESRLVALTNARRKKVGCGALKLNADLTKAARTHTLRMVQTGSFSHQVPKEAGLATRIVRAGYKHWRALAENIAWGQGVSPAKVFDMWMHSAPHRANIQNCGLHDLGYGVRYQGGNVWVTGDFGRD